ncbi:MAG: SIMPL domain-containing protein [Anaerolineales bacterium]|nr:MAG: SIMPL domain-containing protein [Anaerolineales bacterium]
MKISASYREEIFATHADLHVTVKGASILSGAEAMKKAKEVNQLVEARERMLTMVIEKAKAKAKKAAASLGVKLLGVYDFIENAYDEEAPMPYLAQSMPRARAAAAPEPSLGMDVQHNKTIHVSVDVWYRVSAF